MLKAISFKRVLVFLMAVLMLVSAAACGNTPSEAVDSDSAVNTPDQSAANGTKEKLSMTIAWNEAWTNSSTNKSWPTDIASYIFEKTGVTFDINGMDDEKFKVLLAGGDLPDLLFLQNASYNKQLIEGNQILPLDELVKSNGPDIQKNIPQALEMSKKFNGGKNGELYFLPNNVGDAPSGFKPAMGYVVRWDYYKELGNPQFKDEMELLEICADMQKKHPKTEEGKNVYAMGFHNEWANGLWAWKINCYREGYSELPQAAYLIKNSDNSIAYNYMDTDSPFWKTLKLANKANRMGLLDPDSFTMKVSDYNAKAKAGQYLTSSCLWWMQDFNGEQTKKDPNTDKGYVIVPVEGTSLMQGQVNNAGAGKMWAISKNCQNPARAMDLINYFYSADGARTVTSGVKGKHWDIVDGKPQFNAETLKILTDPAMNDQKDKIGFHGFYNLIGLGGAAICEDGEIADLKSTAQVLKANLTGVDKDFSEYYKVEYPGQLFDNLVKDGKMFDQSKAATDINGLIGIQPDDIKVIDAKIDDLVMKNIPRIVLAKTDADYSAAQQKLIEDLKAAGYDKSAEFWTKQYNDTKAAIGK